MTDRLYPGQSLGVGNRLISNNDRYVLILQKDGNLVIYRVGTMPTIWSTGTHGRKVFSAVMQTDGNFVIYGSEGAIWSTDTDGNRVAWLVMQEDGNLVLYKPDGTAIWSSGTFEPVEPPLPPSTGNQYCCTVVGSDGVTRRAQRTITANSKGDAIADCSQIAFEILGFGSGGFGVSDGEC